ncbi:MAG: hypothetical protein JRH20_15680 [Deltaproteobacteria bacterium]|nr:hypothetical protein [Deltaproteobacteria bacterium]
MRIRSVAWVFLLWGCASAPPPPAPVQKPPRAIVVKTVRFVQPAMDQLSFRCGRAHPGVELRVALLDARGRELGQQDVRVGKVFGGRTLLAGSRVRLRLRKAPEASLKVVGRRRPMATVRSLRLDVAELTSIRLVDGQSCRREGDEELTCSELRDRQIGRTLRLVRSTDPTRGTLHFEVSFNRDFERGVKFEAQMLDAKGGAHARCRLRITQPQVFETQRKGYTLVAHGQAAAATLAAVKRLWVVSHRELEEVRASPRGEAVQEVRLFCGERPRIRRRGMVR